MISLNENRVHFFSKKKLSIHSVVKNVCKVNSNRHAFKIIMRQPRSGPVILHLCVRQSYPTCALAPSSFSPFPITNEYNTLLTECNYALTEILNVR